MTSIGIVGSRRRKSEEDQNLVREVVYGQKLRHLDLELVSGGCPVGADNFAEQAAAEHDVPMTRHLPIFPPNWQPKHRGEAAEPYYKRNKKIAQSIQVLYCLVAPNRKGGTENTIKYAREEGIEIWVHDGIKWILEFSPQNAT